MNPCRTNNCTAPLPLCRHDLTRFPGESSIPRRIPASDAHALLAHLSATSQSLFHELYVLDSNIHVPPETCYSLQYSTPSPAEAAFTLRPLGQVLDFCEKAHALHHALQAAASSRWDLTHDESGRSVSAC
jgi:hypothetical protein